MTCFMSVYFKIPARLVRNELNDYCDYQRRRVLQNEYEMSSFNKMSVRFFFQYIDFLEEDTLTPQLVLKGYDKRDFLEKLLQTVAGLPSISELTQPQTIELLPPQFENFSNIKVNATETTITIADVAIDRDGFIYAMIDYQNLTKMPSFYEVREGQSQLLKNSNESTIKNSSYYYRSHFSLVEKTGLQFEFTGLTHYTNYSIFIYASADDPSYFQPRTYVHRIDVQTPPKYVNDSKKLITILILILLTWC